MRLGDPSSGPRRPILEEMDSQIVTSTVVSDRKGSELGQIDHVVRICIHTSASARETAAARCNRRMRKLRKKKKKRPRPAQHGTGGGQGQAKSGNAQHSPKVDFLPREDSRERSHDSTRFANGINGATTNHGQPGLHRASLDRLCSAALKASMETRIRRYRTCQPVLNRIVFFSVFFYGYGAVQPFHLASAIHLETFHLDKTELRGFGGRLTPPFIDIFPRYLPIEKAH